MVSFLTTFLNPLLFGSRDQRSMIRVFQNKFYQSDFVTRIKADKQVLNY
ncbi:hypothetical protein SAMN03080598_00196 [Algoriphagus boritolerans DSM 17298 = JCM 18970]|uniref:Uncharacterized protein n=1 Tax=Algoriphagus boritolerans DSM 17298 = JCM 18970 TaxID=1120964 RepID=A0A1H5RZP8_9BACT|nr:hypothetical protein SAMN03080598_00196 [Algoriphagus boritolerans DSM 17298 = JCM 18970]